MSNRTLPTDRMTGFDFDVVTDAPPLRSRPPEGARAAPQPPAREPTPEPAAADPR